MGVSVEVDLTAVVVAVTKEVPRVLTRRVTRSDWPGDKTDVEVFPYGVLDPTGDTTLTRALRRWVQEQTNIPLGYVEQLYTFGDRFRHPKEQAGKARRVSVAYIALVREQETSNARWSDIYTYLEWEDWRAGEPAILSETLVPALEVWVDNGTTAANRDARRQRADIEFGLHGAVWNQNRVLERYELLYEVGLTPEVWRDRSVQARKPVESEGSGRAGRPMGLDHRRMLAVALARIRGKIRYRPLVFELLPAHFTLLALQRVVEALAGVRLHKQNFRRLVISAGLVEGSGRYDDSTGGRPAELFRFRPEVLRERPAPGVGLPGVRTSG